MKTTKKQKPTRAGIRRTIKEIIVPRWRLISIGLVLITLSRICGLVLPYSSKVLIDDVITNQNVSLLALLTIVSIAVCINAASSYALTLLLSVEAHRLIVELRMKIQEHVIHLPLSYFDNTKTGTLVSRTMNDVEGVRNLVGTGLLQLVGGILQSGVAFCLLLNINAQLTFIMILPLAAFAFIAMKAFAYIRPIFRARSAIIADVTGRLTESLGGIRVIKGFHAEQGEQAVFQEGAMRIFENVRASLKASSAITSSTVAVTGVASVLIMGFGGRSILENQMSVGDFFAFTLILGFLVAPIFQMANIGTQITEAFAGLDRMQELLSEPREDMNQTRTETLSALTGDMKFDNVTFAYEEGVDVLKQVSFDAPSGSVTALVGSSGSGKTTIASLAASFLTPRSGKILIDDVDLSTIKLDNYRQNLGVVLQDDFLFEGSIKENILFARPAASQAELSEVLESANVAEFIERMPNGIDTIIGERGVKLSGGQRQRVAIARALIANPKILILDEATSSLDTESEALIQESLSTLMKGRTTFVIAHRLSTIRQADQILVIEDGEIAERGDHDSLIESEGRYFELYTYQARI
jgi:subfamily B ATP-binding cassette protein MsbA